MHARTTGPNTKAFRLFSVLDPPVLSLELSFVVVRNPNRPMGCCCSTATVPSEPPLSTPATQRMEPVPVPPQTSSKIPSIPSSRTLYRARGRRPLAESSSRRFSQDSNPRSRTESAPQPPQSSKSSSKNPRARAATLTAPKWSNRPDSRSLMPGESGE